MTKMVAMSVYGKKNLKNLHQKQKGCPMFLKLGISTFGLELYKVCINDDPTYFLAR